LQTDFGGILAIILGIDPGSLHTGWGILEIEKSNLKCHGFGVLHLPEKLNLSLRLAKLHIELGEIIRKYKPVVLSVEKVFFGKNADSAFKLGQARGVVVALAGLHELELTEYATRHVKKMLTGNGAASKEQVQMIIGQLLKVKHAELAAESLDATDALAVAVCHAREFEVRSVYDRVLTR
jgi:crossover junction endodeoxyribonuclease RuvC